ncbi:MAG TPA: TPM domain-containing protein [Steroidobacteraceae bacterium]|nr:TPM domain-containing protein [Steroidobacteraceae bacterium]
MINETDQHDFDLAFRMSLKLAEGKSGIENALVLMKSLPPSKSIEEAAADIFERMRIGARRNGRGILYLYSAKENLLKIEVSYALEGDIPDAYCHRLEEAAKTYMLSEVPQDFISELIITTNLRGMGSKDLAGDSAPRWLNAAFLSGGAGALARGYRHTLADYQGAIRKMPDADLLQFAPSPDAEESLRRYRASLALGLGDPRLPLLTEGSRIFRAIVPRNEEQQLRINESFGSAGAYRMLYANGLALAVAGPGKSNLPILLRRGSDNLWYVDEAKAWTYFHRFEDNVNFFVKYADNPFLAALESAQVPNMQSAIYGTHVRTPAMPAYPFALSDAVQSGEQKILAAPAVAAGYAELADLYLFEMNWQTRALELYEKAAALAPEELTYRWRLVDLYLNTSRAEKMLAEFKFLADHQPADKQLQDWYRAYEKIYDFGKDL